MGYLSFHSSYIYDNELCVVFGVFIDIDCNKCGQTSRPVVRAKIQTSCDFEATYVVVFGFWLVSTVASTMRF